MSCKSKMLVRLSEFVGKKKISVEEESNRVFLFWDYRPNGCTLESRLS